MYPDGTCGVQPVVRGPDARPLDRLLGSVADGFGSSAVGLVLTGMGRDGAEGVVALKAAGAVVIAESEQTAEQPSMPKAAADAGADLVLPVDEIGPVLLGLVRGEPLPRPVEELEAVEPVTSHQRPGQRQPLSSSSSNGPITLISADST